MASRTGTYARHYVSILVLHQPNKGMTPIEIIWDDGRRFPVRVRVGAKWCTCQHTRGYAWRYDIVVKGRPKELYRDDTGWFVEEPLFREPRQTYDPRSGPIPY